MRRFGFRRRKLDKIDRRELLSWLVKVHGLLVLSIWVYLFNYMFVFSLFSIEGGKNRSIKLFSNKDRTTRKNSVSWRPSN
jgi:hypothetical protein